MKEKNLSFMKNRIVMNSFADDKEQQPKPTEPIIKSTFEQKMLMINNLLLGKLLPNSNYVIEMDILKELVAVNKIIKEKADDRIIAVANHPSIPEFSLKFLIIISISEDEKTKHASLFLLEEIENEEINNRRTLSTLIAKYKDDNDTFFIAKVKKIFNLSTLDESEGKDTMDETLVKLVLAKKSKLAKIKSFYSLRGELFEKQYVNEMTELLKTLGAYGEFVLKMFLKYQEGLANKIPQKDGSNYFTTLSRLLDKAMEQATNYPLPKEVIEKINQIKHRREQNYESAAETAINPPVPQVVKEIPKSSSSSGGGTKSKSKGASSESGGKSKGGGAGGNKSKSKFKKAPDDPSSKNTIENQNKINEALLTVAVFNTLLSKLQTNKTISIIHINTNDEPTLNK